MDSETQDLYLQKLEEFVYDEDKIVSFTWLSNELGITVTESKNLLGTYVEDQRQSKPDVLCVTYLICGTLKDGNGYSITLAEENKVSEKEGLFEEVSSKHIYSVQKSKEFNVAALAILEHLNINEPKGTPILGSIISKNCIKRIFKEKKALPVLKPTLMEKVKPSLFGKVVPKTETPAEHKETPKATNNGTQNKSQQKSKQNGVMSMFAKAATKQEVKKESTPGHSPEKENKNNLNKGKDVESESSIKSDAIDVDDDEEMPIQKPKGNQSKAKQEAKPKRKKQTKNNKSDSTKRKRIIEQSDSDSDDIFGGSDKEEPEDIIDNSFEEPEPVYKAPAETLGPKNKKRKKVQETVQDGDYITTKTVYVYESASEEEAEVKSEAAEVPKPPSPKQIKKADSQQMLPTATKGKKGKKNAPTNQPNIMSFFKKK